MLIRSGLAALAGALVLAGPASGVMPDAPPDSWSAPREPAPFALPLAGPLESPFGTRWGRLHAGLDIGVLETDEVRAPLGGVVKSVGYLPRYGGYGNVVLLRHGGGMTTLYAHLASAVVAAGQQVARGDLLGHAGCTGSCTGTHLHFEVRLKGEPVDPMPYLEPALAALD